jgi:Zn-dependent peptidase ImmA (M78 family)/transcriptional regulator with XRE-family HTH domain
MDKFNSIIKNNTNFIPERLKEARTIRGYSVVDFADKIGVKRQSIYQYELGEIIPKSEILGKIIDELNFPISYFTRDFDDYEDKDRTTIFFRSLKSSDKTRRDAAKVRAKWVERAFTFLQNSINYPKINIPKLDYIIPYEAVDIERIEEITQTLRDHWGVGNGPIQNIVALLEKNGFFVSRFEIGENKTDGFSYWIKNRPYIFLASDKNCAVRSRFDAAHELGHLILHFGIDMESLQDSKILDRIEKEANTFASAFLLPRNTFGSEIMSSSIDSFVTLKKRWRVSIAAMIYRCESLCIFSDNQIIYLNKQISIRKWRKSEPFDNEMPLEMPSLLKQSINLLIKSKIRNAIDFINYLCVNASELEDVYCLEKGSLSNELNHAPVIQLRLV